MGGFESKYLIDNRRYFIYNDVMEKTYNCPICGGEASSRHHVKPRSQGGTDSERNIVYLCKKCHDVVEEIQEERGIEFCPDLITELRLKMGIRLGHDEDGIEECWSGNVLLWIYTKNKTKQYINQLIAIKDEQPASTTIPIITEQPKRKRGRPINKAIDTAYLNILVFNQGLSLSQVVHKLKEENGFIVSREFVRKRLNQPLPSLIKCGYKKCNVEFTPKNRWDRFCCPEHYQLEHRDYKESKCITKTLKKPRLNLKKQKKK